MTYRLSRRSIQHAFARITLLLVISTTASGVIFSREPIRALVPPGPNPIQPTPAGKVVVTWFVGLGTGESPQQIEVEQQVVNDFNASHPDIELQLLMPSEALEIFESEVAAGNPPDIVGPMAEDGINRFEGNWLDLEPLIKAADYDLGQFPLPLVNYYRGQDGLIALPFDYYPALLYYNRDLFDRAGMKYPPQQFGEKYTLPDGSQADWNYDTLAKIARMLTVDENGNVSTSPHFDPNHIVQFGFDFQWATMRSILSGFQPDHFYDPSTHRVEFPDEWRTAAQWLWDGVWRDHFIPNAAAASSDLLGQGNAFQSGHLAMALVPLWYTCCLNDSVGVFKWDIGVVPKSFDDHDHVMIDADTFAISKASQHPAEAFTALSYLVGEAEPQLTAAYGAFPVRAQDQQDWFDARKKRYDWDIHWEVVAASTAVLNPESLRYDTFAFPPDYPVSQTDWQDFLNLLIGDTGKDVDVPHAFLNLNRDLQELADAYR